MLSKGQICRLEVHWKCMELLIMNCGIMIVASSEGISRENSM